MVKNGPVFTFVCMYLTEEAKTEGKSCPAIGANWARSINAYMNRLFILETKDELLVMPDKTNCEDGDPVSP